MNLILEEGLMFLCVGMGVVCLFLSLMVCLMMLNAKVSVWLSKLFPEAVAEVKASSKAAVAKGSDEAEIAAAIAIAHAQN